MLREEVVDQHEPIGDLIPPRSQIGSPVRRKQILRPAVEEVPGLESAAKGLKRFGFTTKPAVVVVEAAVVMRVSCGEAVNRVVAISVI